MISRLKTTSAILTFYLLADTVAFATSDVWTAYQLSWKAESLCKVSFRTSDTNDESDACRHYIWAGLMRNAIGAKEAREILDAHEGEPDQPEHEKAMDLANNRAGLIAEPGLVASKKFGEKKLMELFHKEINEDRLIVLKRKITKEQRKSP